LQVNINGQSKEIPDHLTLSGLVAHLELASERIAVELNREVVRRKDWSTIKLREGDQLEIVHFVGGGDISWKPLI
jgi:thiamine biosynthesis protein ThiS